VSAVGPLVAAGLSGLQIEAKIREHTAPLVWAEVVGPQVAGATEVIGISGGVLRVATKSSVWSQELTFYKADIVRRLNARIGTPLGGSREPAVKDILFQNRGLRAKQEARDAPPTLPLAPSREELEDVTLSPGEIETIEASLASLVDETLRARLRRVRVADARLRTWRLDSGWVPCPRCGDLAPPVTEGAAVLACRRCRIGKAVSPGGAVETPYEAAPRRGAPHAGPAHDGGDDGVDEYDDRQYPRPRR